VIVERIKMGNNAMIDITNPPKFSTSRLDSYVAELRISEHVLINVLYQ
jgi:hypothetical protein